MSSWVSPSNKRILTCMTMLHRKSQTRAYAEQPARACQSSRRLRQNASSSCCTTASSRWIWPAPGESFSSANEEAEAALYQLGTVAAEPVVATWDQGLRMQVDCTFSEDGDGPVDMIVVPGGPGVERASAHGERAPGCAGATPARAALAASAPAPSCWLAPACSTAASSPRTGARPTGCASCTRAAGGGRPPLRGQRQVLDLGRRLGRHRPGPGLIERDHGPELSQQVARRLVVFMRRGGDQRQYSQTLRLQDRAGAPFRELVQKMEARLSARWSIDDMADACGMSRRTFNASSSRISAWRPRKCCACCGASAPAPCRRPARCRRRKWKAPGADGLTGPPRLPAGGMAALPRPTDTPPHTWISCPVTKAARRSMNMATTCATSSGKPLRPTGIAASSARVRGSPGDSTR